MSRFLFILEVSLLVMTPRLRAESPQGAANEISVQRDIVYETIDRADVKLDIATPNGQGPYPIIICIHGGAWRIGDKSKFGGAIEEMARRGYVAASINYRFAPKYRFPAQLDDAKAAMLFLKSRAVQYKIDVNHVGVTGESAGSHLGMLMGMMEDAKDATPLTSTRVQAIVNYFGPTDLTRWEVAPFVQFLWQKRFHESMEEAMLEFLGTKDPKDPRIKEASPVTYVNKDSPPVLTFHGTLDPVVPYHQAEILHDALRKAGVPEKLVPIENGMHGAWAPEAREAADKRALAFFDQYLKGKADAHADASGPKDASAVAPIQNAVR